MKLSNVLAAVLAPSQAAATAVFAHFMVGNTPDFTVSDWASNMNLAKDAHIDAFALNMAYDWHGNEKALELAFQAGSQSGFQLFFSFDYAGNGPWPQGVVQSYIQKYGKHSAYFQHNGQPLVSTFEGPENAQDWVAIKQSTGCFFVPDWSSLGAGPASTLAGGVADGLFNWAAWAYGKNNMTTYVDASYTEALKKAGNKPYMMPVSPWFYTNLPGYNKNWAWRGDNLWYDRWQHVWNVKPEWVQIISWNDYGESHYIGPLDDRQYEAFEIGKAPYNFVKDMPHDGWRTHLPFLIDTYKNRNPSVLKESVVMWHRRSPGKNCNDGGTTGNTASQLQIEYEPSQIFEDRIYVAALLASPATLQITDGEHLNELVTPNEWDYIPADGVGIYQTSVPMDSMVDRAEVNAELNRAVTFATAKSSHTISSTCNAGLTNWNAVVSSGYSSQAAKSDKALKLSEQACVEGFGATRFGDFNKLCSFTCKYNYCPLTACVCTKSGKALKEPKSLGIKGYSSNGDANYDGLCDYTCDHGYCPPEYCSTTKPKPYIPPNSPFSNEACVNGEARSSHPQYDGLCRYSCNLGYCPTPSEITGQSASADDAGICNFACSRGYCPTPCISSIPVNFLDDSCTSEMQAKIQGEMSDAYDMALAAKDHLQNGPYYEHFFPKSLRDQPDFAKDIAKSYELIADLLSGRSEKYKFHVTCNRRGMGTGVTTTDKCRVGSNNYGDLIYNYFGSSSIPYQRLSCSGDTTDGLNAQIDKWTGADQVDLVTLTMGGNDLGFSDLVYYCVITPNTWRWGSSNRNWCAEAKKKARDHMADTSSNGLQARLKAAYQRILDKTGRQDTQLYVAGYPTFFDTAGKTCDKSTFHYVWAGYNPSSDWPLDRIVYLTQDLRIELNNLVRDLNDVIIEAVNDANNAQEYTQVHYVDVSYAFESGNHLCGWPDVDADAAAASGAEAAERQALFAQGSIPLPDPATCDDALGSNPDPYASYMCRLSHVVTDFPGGPEAALYNKANGDVKAGNFNSQEVNYFYPTRQIKTFHPRTPGMYQYRDEILKKIAQTSGL
ncbi:Mutanase Pc12g07500-like protein 1 [Colletotrichum chlorophyti]|uniref:Mutanase Pc12g07500-like protein 1 n=1 Tax=Colletotrichum chlorophyti TaxID=708187 RepID=A0A1Q8S5V5_9PEZI|nr:Mutanase Pc12g07500-like protein 1 [Colletotrichum chlorophyti]